METGDRENCIDHYESDVRANGSEDGPGPDPGPETDAPHDRDGARGVMAAEPEDACRGATDDAIATRIVENEVDVVGLPAVGGSVCPAPTAAGCSLSRARECMLHPAPAVPGRAEHPAGVDAVDHLTAKQLWDIVSALPPDMLIALDTSIRPDTYEVSFPDLQRQEEKAVGPHDPWNVLVLRENSAAHVHACGRPTSTAAQVLAALEPYVRVRPDAAVVLENQLLERPMLLVLRVPGLLWQTELNPHRRARRAVARVRTAAASDPARAAELMRRLLADPAPLPRIFVVDGLPYVRDEVRARWPRLSAHDDAKWGRLFVRGCDGSQTERAVVCRLSGARMDALFGPLDSLDDVLARLDAVDAGR